MSIEQPLTHTQPLVLRTKTHTYTMGRLNSSHVSANDGGYLEAANCVHQVVFLIVEKLREVEQLLEKLKKKPMPFRSCSFVY